MFILVHLRPFVDSFCLSEFVKGKLNAGDSPNGFVNSPMVVGFEMLGDANPSTDIDSDVNAKMTAINVTPPHCVRLLLNITAKI